MQNDRSFIDELKYQYKYGGMHIKLIFANVIVFLLISILSAFGNLLAVPESMEFWLRSIFTLSTNFSEFIYRPWGLFTSFFSHFGILHLAFNMLMLYFAGKAFEHYFGAKRLLAVYIIGGLVGGISEMLAHNLFPGLATSTYVLGASGSTTAIFIALAFYKPNMPVALFGVIQMKIIYLGLAYIALDLINLGVNDNTAHFAHVGGAIVGILAAQQPNSSRNLLVRIEHLMSRISKFFTTFNKGKSGRKPVNPRMKTDEEFNMEVKERQRKTDQILEKISKSGYESLSKAEKEFLFRQSNKNG